jgi:hypothetical protein
VVYKGDDYPLFLNDFLVAIHSVLYSPQRLLIPPFLILIAGVVIWWGDEIGFIFSFRLSTFKTISERNF